jgi:hypothetical protein
LAAVLVTAAVLKAGNREAAKASLSTFGIRGRTSSALALGVLVTVELALAAGVAAGLDGAAYAAAGLMLAFAAAIGIALARGRSGAPCACFGARSTLDRKALIRNLLLAAAFASLPFLPSSDLTTDQWLGIGLGAALLACAGLAVAVLALAREVGMLRLQAGGQGALEIAEEGPPLGEPAPILSPHLRKQGASLGLAVFTSEGCSVCRSLEPAINSLANEPTLAVTTFEEVRDAEVWRELEIPGSPFAVAVDQTGTVLAKGTFNNLAQLESVAATAARRRAAGDELLNGAHVHA